MEQSVSQSGKQAPTDHELRVLRTVVELECVKQAALALGLSPRTVDNHLANLRRKSGRSTVTQLWLWVQETHARRLPKRAKEDLSPELAERSAHEEFDFKGVSDAQWARIALVLPQESTRGRRRVDYRKIVNGILFKLGSGCSWDNIPRCFCTRSTGSRHYWEWVETGIWQKVWQEFYTTLGIDKRREWAMKVLENGGVPHVYTR